MSKDIVRVFIPNLIKMFVAVLTAFVIPKYLSVEEYGYIKLFQLYVSYIGLFGLGYTEGVFVKYGGKCIDGISKKQLSDEQTTLVIWQMIYTAIMVFVSICCKDFVLLMFGLSFIPSTILTYYLLFFQSLGMFNYYGKIYNIHSILTLLIDSIFLFVFKFRFSEIYIIAIVIANAVVDFSVFLILKLNYEIGLGCFRWKLFKENVNIGFIIMIGNMAYVVFSGIDKWFVKLFEGLANFSFYAFAVQLLSVINMFVNPIGYTLYSYFSRKKSKEFEYLMKKVIIAWVFFALSGVYIIKCIINYYLPTYKVAIPVINLLFFGQMFYLINNTIYVNLFKVYRKQMRYLINIIIIIILSFFLNIVLYFGIMKTIISFAYATVICMIIWSFLNVHSFRYLWLKKKDIAFVIGVSAIYFFSSIFDNVLIGGGIYIIGYCVLFITLMNDLFGMGVMFLKEAMKVQKL